MDTTDSPTDNLCRNKTRQSSQPQTSCFCLSVAELPRLYNLIVLTSDDLQCVWLADGFHRYWAAMAIEAKDLLCEVRQGTVRDAILYSVGANAKHGLRRTNADKRKAVLTMLTNPLVSVDDDGNPWSNNAIAQRCQVDPKTVASVRSGMEIHSCATRKGTDGKLYNTANIGRAERKKRQPGGISPNAALPTRQARPALAQTNLNLPHDPAYGARAIVAAMGEDYALRLIDSLTSYLRDKKEGDA